MKARPLTRNYTRQFRLAMKRNYFLTAQKIIDGVALYCGEDWEARSRKELKDALKGKLPTNPD